jgi:phosphoglycolate phosphatase-like HAD superfamily hydrolase
VAYGVLFERDGVLIVPGHHGDPSRVMAVAEAREALERLRAERIPVGVVSRDAHSGLMARHRARMVNLRTEELLGPFQAELYLKGGRAGPRRRVRVVRAAAARLGVTAAGIVWVSDREPDVLAAAAAGGRGILVPSGTTSGGGTWLAPEVEPTVAAAVDLIIDPEGHRARVARSPLAHRSEHQPDAEARH